MNREYNTDNSYLFVYKTQIFKFKDLCNLTPYLFCLGSVSNDFTNNEMNEIAINVVTCDFSIDCWVTYAKNMLHIYDYLKKNIIQNDILIY